MLRLRPESVESKRRANCFQSPDCYDSLESEDFPSNLLPLEMARVKYIFSEP